MSITPPLTIANKLLEALPSKTYLALRKHMDHVTLNFGEIIYLPHKAIEFIYFPIDSLVSLLTQVEGHQALEVGMVGNEGLLGLPLALGVNNSSVRAIVQGHGTALRMTAADFSHHFHNIPTLQQGVYRYTHELMTQISQTAACNRFHQVEERLARWLLMTRDRVGSDQFHLTQELLGNMLGARRAGVTKAAGDLRRQHLIGYSRGDITILDVMGLETAACPCYQIVKEMHTSAID